LCAGRLLSRRQIDLRNPPLGGIGNLPGAVLGGVLLGLLETFAGGIPELSNYRDAIAFGILILILLLKPAGLLGRSSVEKV